MGRTFHICLISVLCYSAFGCIVIPIPTPEWGDPLVANEEIAELERGIGQLTDTQVVQMIGAPRESYQRDRVLVYHWSMNQGIWIVAAGSGYYGAGAAEAGTSEHRLCLKFSEHGVLIDIAHADSALGAVDGQVNRVISRWLTEISEEKGAEPPRLVAGADPERPIGVLALSEAEWLSKCMARELAIAENTGLLRRLDYLSIRDDFFPWLDPPWITEHLLQVAALSRDHSEDPLRYVIFGLDRSSSCAADELTTHCYVVRWGDRSKSLSLQVRDLWLEPEATYPAVFEGSELIPSIPNSRQAACEAVTRFFVASHGNAENAVRREP